jgi:hypothetical protein
MTQEDLYEFQFLPDLMAILVSSSYGLTFAPAFAAFASEIASDINNLSLDPGCSHCRNKIVYYVTLYKSNCAEFLYGFMTQNQDAKDYIQNAILSVQNKSVPVDIAGQVASTTLHDWSNFVHTLNTSPVRYKSMNLALSGDNVLVFFS